MGDLVSAAQKQTPRQHEAGELQKLIVVSAQLFQEAGVRFPHSRLVRQIRAAFRLGGVAAVEQVVRVELLRAGRREWLEHAAVALRNAVGVIDPTGETAATNVDRRRAREVTS